MEKIERIERQELTCHNCNTVVQFDVDVSINGNHILKCPKCNHEHCRVVVDGVITDHRWDSRNPINIQVSTYTVTCTGDESWNLYSTSASQTITWDLTTSTGTSTDTDIFCYQNWMNLTTG